MTLVPNPDDAPFDIPEAPDMDKAFTQEPTKLFDLELPWEAHEGRITNKYGVTVGRFENWEHAEFVADTVNAAQQLLDVAAAINTAGKPAEPAPALTGKIKFTNSGDLDALGMPILRVEPNLEPSILVTPAEFERAAREVAKLAFPDSYSTGIGRLRL
jgi:hypothetical protein